MLPRYSADFRRFITPIRVGEPTRPLADVDETLVLVSPKIASFEVDFDRPHALAYAIASGGFCQKILEIDPDNVPPGGCGKCRLMAKEYRTDQELPLHEILRQLVVGQRCAFCPPLGVLEYARQLLSWRLESPMGTIFTGLDGCPSRLVVSAVEGGRKIEIAQTSNNFHFPEVIRFLAIERTR